MIRPLVSLPISLHLGAHKTATTFMQRALRSQAADLSEQGIAVLTPAELRQSRNSSDAKLGPSEQRRALKQHLTDVLNRAIARPGATRIVISEENLIGSSGQNMSRRDLYAGLAERLLALPDSLNSADVTVMFAIRSYAPLHSSGFTTALRRGRRLNADHLAQGLVDAPRGWVDVLRDLHGALPKSPMMIWRYEDFADVKHRLFAQMIGRDLEGPRETVFRTLSFSAVEALQAVQQVPLRPQELKEAVAQISKQYPITDENPAFSLFDAGQAAALDARYARDWDAVQRLFPDAVLRP